MSWLLGKAEDLLNKVDQAAGQSLGTPGSDEVQLEGQGHIADRSTLNLKNVTPSEPQTGAAKNMTPSASVPNFNKYNTSTTNTYLSQTSRSSFSTPRAPVATGSSSVKTSRDKDEELFEFLNAPDSDSNGSGSGGMRRKSSQTNLSRHSRTSSASSTVSSGKQMDGVKSSAYSATSTDPTDVDVVMEQSMSHEVIEDTLLLTADTSSGYHSHDDENKKGSSSLELENRLLKNEVTSLNQEMASVIERAKNSQEELIKVKKKLDLQNQQLSRSDQIVREIQSREADLQETLTAKDSQIGVLRVRLDEADRTVKRLDRQVAELTKEKNRVLEDHTSSSGVQSQALDSLKEKLYEAEENLRREQDTILKIQQESQERQRRLESEQQSLSDALSVAQRKYNDEKVRTAELNVQMKSTKSQVDLAKQELIDYKDKATRILQSKDKLIASLKERSATGTLAESAVSSAELESAKQEIAMLKEEIQHNRMTIENLRADIQDLELQMQQDSDAAQEQTQSLEEQLRSERVTREEAEQEVAKQKQELRFAHEELLKQKTGFQSRLQDREAEIDKLRTQITTRSMSSSTQVELENRLHSLTESLIQKQTMMESLSTEKNSLTLQLERLEKKYRDLELTSNRASVTAVHITDEEDARQRLPGFLKESPNDGEVARRVKRVYSSVDKFSIRLGVFLRRYPVARVFVFGYMALLHLWVMIVLLTYQPEIHGRDFAPEMPQNPHKL